MSNESAEGVAGPSQAARSQPSPRQLSPSQPSLGLSLSAKSLRTTEQPISFLIAAALESPSIINLAAGLVDTASLPIAECDAITRRIFADPVRGRSALQYDTTNGLADLRLRLLQHLERLEGRPASSMGLTDRQIVVTTGSQQALYLIGDALLDPGDIVIAANPSYFVYTGGAGVPRRSGPDRPHGRPGDGRGRRRRAPFAAGG